MLSLFRFIELILSSFIVFWNGEAVLGAGNGTKAVAVARSVKHRKLSNRPVIPLSA